jgi:hypothetical protein
MITDDPVRDAEDYQRELEERPYNDYRVRVSLWLDINVCGQTKYDAKLVAQNIMERRMSMLCSNDGWGIVEGGIDDIVECEEL